MARQSHQRMANSKSHRAAAQQVSSVNSFPTAEAYLHIEWCAAWPAACCQLISDCQRRWRSASSSSAVVVRMAQDTPPRRGLKRASASLSLASNTSVNRCGTIRDHPRHLAQPQHYADAQPEGRGAPRRCCSPGAHAMSCTLWLELFEPWEGLGRPGRGID